MLGYQNPDPASRRLVLQPRSGFRLKSGSGYGRGDTTAPTGHARAPRPPPENCRGATAWGPPGRPDPMRAPASSLRARGRRDSSESPDASVATGLDVCNDCGRLGAADVLEIDGAGGQQVIDAAPQVP